MDFRPTLNLPDPNFTIPMKANLAAAEPQILKVWEEGQLYHLIQNARDGETTFVLHDGPPYTNSPIHIGTALNKILKDFVVKSRSMMGFQAPYVPGFDNHGLPIEQAVMKGFAEKKIQPTVPELREACRLHAQKFIDVQTEQFKRLGVFGMWEKPYTTMDFRFEAGILRVFKRLVEGDYLYKGLRPTLWSPTSRTALADTELVYKDHVSTSIYVRFPLLRDHNGFSQGLPNVYTIIWTTTPWTIPANLAVAFNPVKEYAIVKVGDDHYVIGNELVEHVSAALGWTNVETEFIELGASFEFSKFKHPIFDRESLAVLADYVTMDEGTGVVHTAPGHGRDDFYTGLKYDLPVLTPVDERGVLTAEAGEFAGTYYKDCDTVVVNRLEETGNLLLAQPYQHSYPYAERDGQPVIFRATEQWFLKLDHDGLRSKMLKEIGGVEWLPKSGETRIHSMISGRPDWCISRQRPWGVGIPIFYGLESGEPVLDPVAIEAVAQMVEAHGSDAWFTQKPSEILPIGYKHPKTGETDFRKETDVLDVWFDSGSTSICVLDGDVYREWAEPWPADVYLEGSDQHRGWFNSSLIIGTALKEMAPYRAVITHGMVVDETGLKMSKRLGNIVAPQTACNTVGADVVRYWVASVDWANDVPCSEELLKRFGENYRNVRNTLRFLMANLYDFDGGSVKLMEIDEWAVEQTDILVADCVEAYGRYDFGAVINGVHNFCRGQLSNFYLDVIKDRMYCDGKTWESRRSGQAACHAILTSLVRILTPILPFTCEEIWQRLHGRSITDFSATQSIHLERFEAPGAERLADIAGSTIQRRFAEILAARDDVFAAFEAWKAGAEVKDTQDAIVTYTAEGNAYELLRSFDVGDLATFWKVSWVVLQEGTPSVSLTKTTYAECERSRLRRPDVQTIDGLTLTERDRRAIG